jgi:hypothetical protein
MNQQAKLRVLAVLGGILLLLVLFQFRGSVPAVSGASNDGAYKPMGVENPALHLERLDLVRKLEYRSNGRDIFSAELPPPPAPKVVKVPKPQGPEPPPPDPPLTVPFKFYGFSADPRSGARRGFFTNGEEVFIAAEGDLVQGRFRVLKIGNTTADVEETATGRKATLNLEPGAGAGAGPQG